MQQGQDGLTIYDQLLESSGLDLRRQQQRIARYPCQPLVCRLHPNAVHLVPANSGAQLSCPDLRQRDGRRSLLQATSGTGGTTLVCSTCNFTAHGITTTDVVRVFAGTGQSVRGWAADDLRQCDHVDAGDSSIPGLASGDTFDFITATQGIGRVLVQIDGLRLEWQSGDAPGVGHRCQRYAVRVRRFCAQQFHLRHAGSPRTDSPISGRSGNRQSLYRGADPSAEDGTQEDPQ